MGAIYSESKVLHPALLTLQPHFMKHRAGYVNLIGLPNVGKSTLMNALLGEKLSIISPKAQTTRQRVLGMVNEEDFQLIFSDTPGYINQPAYKLHRSMNELVDEAFEDADVLVLVTDKFQKAEEEKHLVELLRKTNIPSLIIINKMDLCQKEELNQLIEDWRKKVPGAEVLALSAASGINSRKLIRKLSAMLPESPPYYDKDQLSDRNVRFFVTEMVREKIFLHFSAEIPYSTQVVVGQYVEADDIDRIRCIIFVERESQKAILIGKNGEALKKVGTEARKDIEKFIGKKVFLDLFIKVKEKWRNNPDALRQFGYGKED